MSGKKNAQPAGNAGRDRAAARGPRPVKQVPGRRRVSAPSGSRPARPAEGPQNNSGPFSGVRIFYFFLFALLFLALYLSYLLVAPFLHTIILACIFTALSHPLYKRLLPVFRGNGWVASGFTLGLLIIVVLIPLVFFIIQLIPQATRSIMTLAQWLSSAHLDDLVNNEIYPFLGWLNDELTWIDLDVQDMRESLLTFSRRAGQMLLSWGTGFFVDSLNMAANFGLMLLIMFFLFKDGEGMVKTIKHLTPLRAEQEDNIIHNLRRMAKSVLVGGFAVAALQGLVGAIGLAIVGIPPLFWGTVMAFAALVPVLGTALVWVPAVAYLALTGQTTSAIFLLAWCGVLVTSVDSFIRPIIIRGNNKTSLLFLFLAVLGGIKAFGVLGIVYGPLILSFVGVMLGMYSDEYSESLESYHNNTSRKRKFCGPACSPDGSCRKRMPVAPSRRALLTSPGKTAARSAGAGGSTASPAPAAQSGSGGTPAIPAETAVAAALTGAPELENAQMDIDGQSPAAADKSAEDAVKAEGDASAETLETPASLGEKSGASARDSAESESKPGGNESAPAEKTDKGGAKSAKKGKSAKNGGKPATTAPKKDQTAR